MRHTEWRFLHKSFGVKQTVRSRGELDLQERKPAEAGVRDVLDGFADEPHPAILDRMEPDVNAVRELHENRISTFENRADDRSVAHLFEMKRTCIEDFAFLVLKHVSSFLCADRYDNTNPINWQVYPRSSSP